MGSMTLPTQAYTLSLAKQPAPFSMLSFEGREAISETYRFAIEFTSARAAIPVADVLGKPAKFAIEPIDTHAGLPAELVARLAKEPARIFSGIVTAFDELGSSADETRYRVVLEPRLSDLGLEIGSRLFQNQTVPAIIESVLRHYGFAAIDFQFKLRAEYDSREYTTQYGESALAFVKRIAADEGIWFRFEQSAEREMIVFGDDLDAYAREPKLTAPYREEGGMASPGVESVMSLSEHRTRVVQSVTVDDYNHRTAGVTLLTEVNAARDDGTTAGSQYRWGEHHATPDAGKRVATLRHQAELARQVMFEGSGNVIGMTPGAVFRFGNRQLGNAEHGLLLTTAVHRASRKEAYTCAFTAIPSDRIYRPLVDESAKPKITGILPARVMSPDNYKYAYLTPQGWYRIQLPFDLDTWSPGGTSRPVRLAKPYAGRDYGSVHYSSVTSAPDDSTAVCYMVPDRVIPVVVVPGVMGTNLSNNQDEPVWVVDDIESLAGWLVKGAEYRKNKLDPTQTKVIDVGSISAGTALSEIKLRERGWGSISKMFYGDFLVWLQNALNDCHPDTDHGRSGLRVKLTRELVAPSLGKLSDPEVSLSYKYQFPVHAVGYNWLQSNADSASRLGKQIDAIIEGYRKRRYRCEKVILVTHSMGGLVARYCSEVLGYREKILGIVHGVMPATGSATAYRRVKAGTEPGGDVVSYGTSLILGNTSSKVMPVFAQSPGPLQLLPSPEYGSGWLKIRDGARLIELPRFNDPYGEIYTKRGAWWSLIDEELLDPEKKTATEKNWTSFAKLITEQVSRFHQSISGRYHSQTYAFWGDDDQHKTWGDVIWQRTQISSLLNGDAYDVENKPVNANDLMGTIDVVAGSVGPVDIHKTFNLQAAAEDGDGTVPVRSGRAPARHAQAAVGYKGVEHGGAYRGLPQQKFVLWGIVKLLKNVADTPLEYKA
ncbi:type VI secretion system tip protein VgrG [Caballeronia humi]|uniref:Rhs element Vgr protein n=1 Tax=Caballeronia humi TaxID=326474 RepID=A0A158GLU2_9BURK|nr:type VI secretion system tip protein VgrG [Caballeronia humi]SAL33098.1 Rhs element Vgr protein [Caballeronia humi]